MSYMRSIKLNKSGHLAGSRAKEVWAGAIDVLIVSPKTGEPWFVYFSKEQLTGAAFVCFKKFLKDYKHSGDVRWSFTWDRNDRWHSVRRPRAPRSAARRVIAPFERQPCPDHASSCLTACLADRQPRQRQRLEARRLPG